MISIIRFPGTNCELDTQYAYEQMGYKATLIWHEESILPKDTKLVVLAGGFSYGDYLRSGAIAKVSHIVKDIKKYANEGGRVLGICNGFQILTEAGMLPGVLIKNENLHFISKSHSIKAVSTNNAILKGLPNGAILNLPVAHADGNYRCTDDELKSLQDDEQILFTYCDDKGNDANLNGSTAHIAGICNKNKNVFALMPHPERACEDILGSTDGLEILKNLMT